MIRVWRHREGLPSLNLHSGNGRILVRVPTQHSRFAGGKYHLEIARQVVHWAERRRQRSTPTGEPNEYRPLETLKIAAERGCPASFSDYTRDYHAELKNSVKPTRDLDRMVN
jgi:hypothetical protein